MRLKHEPASEPLHIYVKWLISLSHTHAKSLQFITLEPRFECLAHKKPPPPRTLHWFHAQGPMGVLEGWAISQKRFTPGGIRPSHSRNPIRNLGMGPLRRTEGKTVSIITQFSVCDPINARVNRAPGAEHQSRPYRISRYACHQDWTTLLVLFRHSLGGGGASMAAVLVPTDVSLNR